jgi:hypothetical protein
VQIAPLVEAPWYGGLRAGLIALWGLLGLAVVGAALSRARPHAATLTTAAAAAFVLLGGVLPEPLFQHLSAPVEQPLQVVGRAMVGPPPARARAAPTPPKAETTGAEEGDQPAAEAPPRTTLAGALPAPVPQQADLSELTREGTIWLRRAVGRNIMHMVGFGGIAVLGAFVAPPVGVAHLAALIGFAGATEAVQLFTITREASLEDLLIDLLSGLAGLAVGAVLRRMLPNRFRLAQP